MTGAPVVLTSTDSPPLTDTLGTVSEICPENWAAIPLDVSTTSPLPFVSDAGPSVTDRPLAATSTTLLPLPSTLLWNAKLPLRVWPATVRLTPVASIATYGPAGRPPLALEAVLTATEKVEAVKLKAVVFAFSVALSVPVMPAEVTVSAPCPFWIESSGVEPPANTPRPALLTFSVVVRTPATVACVNVNRPESV